MPTNNNVAAVTGWSVAGLLGLALIAQCTGSMKPSASGNGTEDVGLFVARQVTARSLNCRSGPDAEAPVIRGLSRGETVNTGEEQDGWSKVNGERPCWVLTLFVKEAEVDQQIAGSGARPPDSSSMTDIGSSATTSNYTPVSAQRIASYSTDLSSSESRAKVTKKKRKAKVRRARKARYYDGGGCPCSGGRVCIGPRGGRYCITSGGNKRYGV